MPEERLQKIIAAAGVASRRKAEELITAGRVTVNGDIKNELGSKADPATDDIRVDGKPLKAEQHVYILLHKPKGYVTTVTDPEGRPTVMDLVKGVPARVYPVGRLDYLSEGLLLLTNDGEMAAKLTHASTHVPKKYLVKVSGEPTEEQVQQLRDGVQLPAEQGNVHADPREGGRFGGEKRRSTPVKTAPAKIELTREGDNPWYEVTLTEGRNRQIRRMFDFIGHHVEKIKRVEYGPLKLDVENGEFRTLSPTEVTRLKQASEGQHEPPRARDERPRPLKPRGDRPSFSKSRGERPRFSKSQGERTAFQRGSYKDRSEFESPSNERTRTARFDAEGKREADAPPRERSERPRFQRPDRPKFQRSDREGFRDRPRSDRGERPAFRGKPGDRPAFRGKREGTFDRGERPAFRGKPGDRPAFRAKREGSSPRTDRPAFRGKREGAFGRGERPAFRGKPGDRPAFRPKSGERKEFRGKREDRGDRPAFRERRDIAGSAPREFRGRPAGRPERPFRAKPGERKEFRGKREGAGGERKSSFGRGKPGDRPFQRDRAGKKPSAFRKDIRPSREEEVPQREDQRSQGFVDKVAKRFVGKLESGGRGPRRGPGERGKKPSFRKPKDRR